MTRRDVIEAINLLVNKEPIIFTTGYTCREAYDIDDRDLNFYMVGSMGLAASIGIGLALNLKHRKVVIVEGDGSFLMCPNNIFIAGECKNLDLIHIVLDNKLYDSTGGQKTYKNHISFANIAAEAGYENVAEIDDLDCFKEWMRSALCSGTGAFFSQVYLDEFVDEIPKRVSITMKEMFYRMKKSLTN